MITKIKRKIFDFAKIEPVKYEFRPVRSKSFIEVREELINGYFDRQPKLSARILLALFFALRTIARHTIKPVLKAVPR